MLDEQPVEHDYSVLVERARGLVASRERRLLGIAGSPGSGKSTLAERLVADLGPAAGLVPMDGFHLPNLELDRLGLRDEKGSPRTFDATSFTAVLAALRARAGVVGPGFDRTTDEPVPGAWVIGPDVPLVVVEGNYLLLDAEPWSGVRGLLDEAWFCAPSAEVRLVRLAARHVRFGRSPAEAAAWAQGCDAANATLIEAYRSAADLLVDVR